MHICLINDIETGGGAAIAASRLAEGLVCAGNKVTRIVAQPDNAPHSWRTIPVVTTQARWLKRLFNLSRDPNLASASIEAILDTLYQKMVYRKIRAILKEISPDVINVHNIHSARWGMNVVALAARSAPLVWTLHDTWSFTARCCYTMNCELFRMGCNVTCPTAYEYPRLPRWRIGMAWQEKANILKMRDDIAAISPSHWLSRIAQQGLWENHRVDVITNGLDGTLFSPVPKVEARELLGIPNDRPIVLLSSANLEDHRKGIWMLCEALQSIERPLTLLLVGTGILRGVPEHHRIIPMGYVSNPRIMRLIYSVGDFMVLPTLADNAPLVLQESLACGTPCVTTPVGGCVEIIRPGESGWIAVQPTPAALCDAISIALDDLARGITLECSCRLQFEREYTIELMVKRYLLLFQELITKRLTIDRIHNPELGNVSDKTM